MRTPDYFSREDGAARFLAPFSLLYAMASRLRRTWTRPWQAPVPVICIGNLTAGGAGKTPVALAVGSLLREQGSAIHFLSRGYGGRLKGPVAVDLKVHTARDVGDEPLLLAAVAPTWIARDRVAGAKAAIAANAEIIVMDDGLQNPTLSKSLSLVVVDGGFGFGNGRVLPAGPLRQPVADGLALADAVIVIEPDTVGVAALLAERAPEMKILRARMVPLPAAERFAGRKLLAFAGIGRPDKFFATLRSLGGTLIAEKAFPDHHNFSPDEIMRLVEWAQAEGAIPVTTTKDHARLSADAKAMIDSLPVALEWRNPAEIEDLIGQAANS